jgi:hypothetical protein
LGITTGLPFLLERTTVHDKCAFLADEYEDLASHRYIIETGRDILIAFLDN